MRNLLLGLLLISATGHGSTWSFEGEFTKPAVSSPACDFLFNASRYYTRVFEVGANGLTAVVHFSDPKGTGYLHNRSLVGLHGGLGDIQVEKTVPHGNHRVELTASGVFDPEVLVLKLSARVVPAAGQSEPLCTGWAEYTGFPALREGAKIGE